MKVIAFLLLCLSLSFLPPASAQTPPPPDCAPAPFGKGTTPHVVDVPQGSWSVHWCFDKFSYQPVFSVKSANYQLKTLTAAQMVGKSLEVIYRETWALNVGAFPQDPNLAILWTQARDWAEANKPESPLFTVAPNSSYPDRPAYTRTAAGTRSVSAIPGLRAPINTECVCSEPPWRVDSAAGAYCPWIGSEVEPVPQITLCRIVPRP